jgi:carboxypeptidase Q
MKPILFALLLLAVPSHSQQIAISPETRAALVKLGGQWMIADQAYEYDRHLADDIGPRLTGSANYVKATDWGVAEFKRLGLANVHKESWEIPAAWEPETDAVARILTPHEQKLNMVSEGWSPSTPANGVRGSVYYLKSLKMEAVQAEASKIKDAIVLVDSASLAAGEENGFGKLFDSLAQVGAEGARGILLGIGIANNVPSVIGVTGFTGSLAKTPCGNLGLEDTLLLKRQLERGPVEVEFSFKNRIREHVKVDNVVAEIPGREADGEYVIVGGHLDSWHLGTGAEDNGTGAASVMAIAQGIMASGLKPRRTMRFILFGGEEEGLLGSVHYGRDHAAEAAKCAGVFITDTGSDAPKGWFIFGRKDEAEALASIKPELSSLGGDGTADGAFVAFSTDHAPFLIQGVPAFVLWTPFDHYMPIHHKPSDTFEKVNQRDLNLSVSIVGITAYAFADAAGTLKHYSPAELEDQLKSIQMWTKFQDMQDHHMF